MKVLTVFGTRPEAIKLAPVVLELKKHSRIKSFVCVSAQHRQMLDQVLKMFEITPDFDLNIMGKNQTIEQVISKIILSVGTVLDKVKPDIVLLQGDTTTAFTVGFAAFLRKIKIGHVEAGLRSYDKYRPFPEEINRRLLSHLADFHFAPTKQAENNLKKENIGPRSIFVTGNTVIDALLVIAGRTYSFPKGCLPKIDGSKKIIVVTAHRRESFGKPMKNICSALNRITQMLPEAEIIYPVHPNPNVRKVVSAMLKKNKRIHLIEPLSYEPFVQLLKKAYIILTDSGGIQEEAPALHKPVLVMREKTERPEGIACGCARLVGMDPDEIVKQTVRLFRDKKVFLKMSRARNPYGDGKASVRIAAALEKAFARA